MQAKQQTQVDTLERPEYFLALLFWLTISPFAVWLYRFEPTALPMLIFAVAALIFAGTTIMIISNAFQSSKAKGWASLLIPTYMYVYAATNIGKLKQETVVNLFSATIMLLSSCFLA